MVGWIRF